MPQQEVFLEQQAGDRLITVLKTYDRSYAREVFVNVDDEAKKSLAIALEIAKNYDPRTFQTLTDKNTRTFSGRVERSFAGRCPSVSEALLLLCSDRNQSRQGRGYLHLGRLASAEEFAKRRT